LNILGVAKTALRTHQFTCFVDGLLIVAYVWGMWFGKTLVDSLPCLLEELGAITAIYLLKKQVALNKSSLFMKIILQN